MTRTEHEPRAACVEYASPAGWIGTCSRGCCKSGRVATAAAALAAARELIESREVEDSNARTDAYARRHPGTVTS